MVVGEAVGPYRIVATLGEGGMGQVYRAHDPRLDRDVAIKVAAEAFSDRFTREARAIAALNHPNVCHLYDVGPNYLVMELVEGESPRGPMAVEEALPILRQLIDGLEAAHEKGIVHRDLKPANIRITPDGVVKILGFGLAKAMEPVGAAAAANASQLPTITTPAHLRHGYGGQAMTQAGMILGTAAYMSPEQARGVAVDRRTDLWAFGVVLYEMLTGRRLFEGVTMSDTVAAVLTKEPDWTALPANTPPAIRRLLRRCLEKDRKRRLADASDARLEIEDALGGAAVPDAAVAQASTDEAVATARRHEQRVARRKLALVAGVALLAVGATAGGMWLATRPSPPRIVQTTIATTPTTALAIGLGDRDLAMTSDGSRLVYRGNNGATLFLRAFDALEPVSLYTGDVRAPFTSPDGQWVGFFGNPTTLNKVAITGGPAVPLAVVNGGSRGAVWLPNDTIVFATATPGTGLQQVMADGGAVTVLTQPDRTRGEADHVWPEALPGGRAVLFTIIPTTGGVDAAQIAVLDLATRRQTVLVRGGSHAHYVANSWAGSGQTGYLVYAADGMLRAVAFDLATQSTRGTSVPVVPEVVTTATGGVDAVVADGTLVYVRGGGMGVQRTLVWMDRQGQETPVGVPPRAYLFPRVSPDGSYVAVDATDQENDLWLWDLAREALTRLTFAPETDNFPVWMPDGRRLLFGSERNGTRNLYAQAVDGTGMAEQLTTSPNLQNATGLTPDGTRLVFYENSPQTGADVMQVEVSGSHVVTPLVQTPANERNGTVSPDGRWLAYESDDSGALEIYVRPYPDVSSGRWQVSTGGGTRSLWSRDGRELFYVSPSGALMRVGVERGASWMATTPQRLLQDGSVLRPAGNFGRTYDVTPDGRRFLVVKEVTGPGAETPQIVVIQHFDELLRRLVPGN